MTLSADSAAMIVAINMIEDRVIPHLPEPGAYRPTFFFVGRFCFLDATNRFFLCYLRNGYL